MYDILKISDNCSFKFTTEIFRFIATFIYSSTLETHQRRTQQLKQKAGSETSLSILMLRQFYVLLYVFGAHCSDDKR